MTSDQDYQLRNQISYLQRVAKETGLNVSDGEILSAALATIAPRQITEYEAKEQHLKHLREKRKQTKRIVRKPWI